MYFFPLIRNYARAGNGLAESAPSPHAGAEELQDPRRGSQPAAAERAWDSGPATHVTLSWIVGQTNIRQNPWWAAGSVQLLPTRPRRSVGETTVVELGRRGVGGCCAGPQAIR